MSEMLHRKKICGNFICQPSSVELAARFIAHQGGTAHFWVLTSLCWFPCSAHQGRKQFCDIRWLVIPV